MKITSTAFAEGELIPAKYTCDSVNISPPLEWESVTDSTRSFAIICDDPDAPVGTWVHWVIYNIPADTTIYQKIFPPKRFLKMVLHREQMILENWLWWTLSSRRNSQIFL